MSPDRRSWTTPVMAFLRSPTMDTPQHHHDDVSTKGNLRTLKQRQFMNRLLPDNKYSMYFSLHILRHTRNLYPDCRERKQICELGAKIWVIIQATNICVTFKLKSRKDRSCQMPQRQQHKPSMQMIHFFWSITAIRALILLSVLLWVYRMQMLR